VREVAAYTLLAGVYDEIVVDPCYSRWVDFLVGQWGDEVHSVLDVCCGTGLLTAELARQGMHVTGVDASADMLARAAAALPPGTPLVRAVLPDLPVTGPFDAAVSTFDGLNYLTPDDFACSIEAIAERLRPGGWLAFDLHTDAAMRLLVDHPVLEGEDAGHGFTITSEVDPVARTCATTITLVPAEGGEPFRERHEQYVHSDDQVWAALRAAGFADVRVVDEYTDEPVSEGTLRATWLARRRS
jgi:SAM-dependent methyltransferase